jgi:predicted nucleic acid-binding protein
MFAQSSQYIAVLDTCVLAPMPLCDTLLRLAEEPAFYIPKWSDDILLELRSTLHRMGYTPVQAGRRITAMEAAFEDANVTGYERLAASLTNDPKDRHVLAAAVRSGAHAIVTANVKHFPPESVKPYDIGVVPPDDFLVRQIHLNRDLLIQRIGEQARARGISPEALLLRLGRHAPRFAAELRPLA